MSVAVNNADKMRLEPLEIEVEIDRTFNNGRVYGGVHLGGWIRQERVVLITIASPRPEVDQLKTTEGRHALALCFWHVKL